MRLPAIVLTSLLVASNACAGWLTFGGVIHSDTTDTVTGVQSQQLVNVELGLTNEAVLRAQGDALALPRADLPGIVSTATVARAGYATESGHATNADHAASSAFATNATEAVHAQTATALALPDCGIGWKVGSTNYVVTPDTNRVYIASASVDYNGPAVGTVFAYESNISGVLKYSFGDDYFIVDTSVSPYPFYAWALILEDGKKWDSENVYADLPQYFSADEVTGSAGRLYADYVPVTNITVDVSAATVIIIAAQVETNRTDIAALEVGQSQRPTFAATTNIVTGAIGTHAAAVDPHGDRAYADSIVGGGSATNLNSIMPFLSSMFYNASLFHGGAILAANATTTTTYFAASPNQSRYSAITLNCEFNIPGSGAVQILIYTAGSAFSGSYTNVAKTTLTTTAGQTARKVIIPSHGVGGKVMLVCSRSAVSGATLGAVLWKREATPAEIAGYTYEQ